MKQFYVKLEGYVKETDSFYIDAENQEEAEEKAIAQFFRYYDVEEEPKILSTEECGK